MSAMPPIATARYVTGLLNLSVLLSPICQRRAQFYECRLGISDCCCFVSAEIVGRAFHIDDRALNSRMAAAIRGWFAASLRIVCAWHIAVLPQASTTAVTSEIRNLFISFSMLQYRAPLGTDFDALRYTPLDERPLNQRGARQPAGSTRSERNDSKRKFVPLRRR